MVFQTLNILKWARSLRNSEIIIRSRGSADDKKVIAGDKLTEVKKSHFLFVENGKEVFIPNHRILEVKHGKEIVWRRK